MIEMKHINLSFRDKDLFTDQEIKIDSGKITLITGESGSGKSTLLFELARLTDYANTPGRRRVRGPCNGLPGRDR